MPDEIAPLLITEKATARLIGVSDSTLIAARFRGKPLLPFVRIGKRSIRYRVTDVHAFVDQAEAGISANTPPQDDRLTVDAPRRGDLIPNRSNTFNRDRPIARNTSAHRGAAR